MNRRKSPILCAGHAVSRTAFTLIELLVSIAVIALLLGILSVALSSARATAQNAVEGQLLQGLSAGIASFENDHRFIPPMVKDNSRDKYNGGWDDPVFETAALREGFGYAGTNSDPKAILERSRSSLPRQYNWVNVFNFSRAITNEGPNGDREYLRGDGIDLLPANDDFASGDYRFSEYSMPYYILGVLPERVDYQDGPGIRGPSRRGSFSPGVAPTGPYFDIGNDADALFEVDAENGRYELRTPSGVAIRYYRWLPGMVDPGSDAPSYLEDDADGYRTYDVIRPTGDGSVPRGADDLNLPWVVGLKAGSRFDSGVTGYTRVGASQFRSAEWALVTAGDDGIFGDYGTESAETVLLNADVDPASSDAGERLRAAEIASEDNGIAIGGGS